MSTTTSRVGLYKPASDGSENVNVVTDLNNNLDKLDSWLGATICTSGTRPGTPFDGQIIKETDTLRAYVYHTPTTTWLPLILGSASQNTSINLSNVANQVNIGSSGSAASFTSKRTNSTDLLLAGRSGSDTFDRFSATQAGGLSWGPGSGATDTNLYRSAANTLKTDDSLEVVGTLNATGAAALGATLAVTGDTTLNANLTVAGVGKHIMAYATADETRTSTTTLTSSSYITASLGINAVYKMHLWWPFTGPTANAFKWGWTYPTGMTMRYGGVYYTGGFFGRHYIQTDTNLVATTEGTSISGIIHFAGMVFMSSTAGSLTLQWAQSASSATAVTLFKGAFMHLERVA